MYHTPRKSLFLPIVLLFGIWSSFVSHSQCSSCPASPLCIGGNGLISNNQNINSGQTYWYTGSGDSYDISFSGGTLIVCGSLTINNINFNGPATIYISAGASLTVNSAISLNNNASVYNFGHLTVNSNFAVSSPNTTLSNCSPSSVINISNDLFVNGLTATLINFGTLNATNLFLQGGAPGQACFGSNSQTNVTNFTSNTPNSIQVPVPTACLSYTGTAQLNGTVTQDPGLIICAGSSSNIIGASNFGNATFNSNCSSCSIALPVEWYLFSVAQEGSYVRLSWSTITETNNDHFTIERSRDAIHFSEIGILPGAGNSTNIVDYTFNDYNPLPGVSYYRIKQTDFNNEYQYHEIKSTTFSPSDFSIISHPNPAENEIFFVTTENKSEYLEVYNSIGANVTSQITTSLNESVSRLKIDISKLESGLYIIKTKSAVGRFIKK